MSYKEFMLRVNLIVGEGMTIKWTISQIRNEAKALGVVLGSDFDVIQVIEIAKNYKIKIY